MYGPKKKCQFNGRVKVSLLTLPCTETFTRHCAEPTCTTHAPHLHPPKVPHMSLVRSLAPAYSGPSHVPSQVPRTRLVRSLAHAYSSRLQAFCTGSLVNLQPRLCLPAPSSMALL